MAVSRILHMHFGKEGGAERFFVNLAEALHERGVEQRFVVRPGRLWFHEIAALGPTIESEYRRIGPTSWWLQWRVHRMIHKWKPDVIMAWMSRSSRLVPDYPGALKLTRLGDYPRHLKNFRRNDLIVANAPGIAEACRDLGWKKPLRVISNFVRDIDIKPVTRKAMDTPEDAFVVVGSGRFIHRKGFDSLIRAVAEIPDAWLWLVGDGDKREEMESLINELGMAGRTRFTGWVEEAMNYVASGSIFVMPSRHEPLGNVILEAWQTDVPVVSTRSEGPMWFVRDGEDALMCDIDDVEAMRAAILRIRGDQALADRLRQAGRKRLAEDFSRESIVDSYMDLFEHGVKNEGADH